MLAYDSDKNYALSSSLNTRSLLLHSLSSNPCLGSSELAHKSLVPVGNAPTCQSQVHLRHLRPHSRPGWPRPKSNIGKGTRGQRGLDYLTSHTKRKKKKVKR
ncbi:hypothetical protein EUGRSUZ_H02627 [Eucalyptus grandis]|uniref:Uncharacterized protein n=2 Tax=Eucalyptus grandis TaxID=71139 RepID=A0A059B2L9_EUCGR|nr:hypothetical protein EUGRSUZ_H02627 [Eucalyptus grandis]